MTAAGGTNSLFVAIYVEVTVEEEIYKILEQTPIQLWHSVCMFV